MGNLVNCAKLGQMLEGLDSPPIPGELGEKILANISSLAWQGWLAHQTMLINEHRLSMADVDARKFLRDEMEKYFFAETEA